MVTVEQLEVDVSSELFSVNVLLSLSACASCTEHWDFCIWPLLSETQHSQSVYSI